MMDKGINGGRMENVNRRWLLLCCFSSVRVETRYDAMKQARKEGIFCLFFHVSICRLVELLYLSFT